MLKRTIIVALVLIISILGILYYFNRAENIDTATGTLDNIMPFGSGDVGPTTNPTPGIDTGASEDTINQKPRLFKLSDVPVSGAVAFENNGALKIRYVERATGHIVDIDPVSLAKVKIVNTTIPKVYEAIWKPDGSAVIFRTLRDIETVDSTSYSLIPPTGTSTSDLYTTRSYGLPANITAIDTSENKIFYTIKNQPQITIANFDGSKSTTLWTSTFNQWNISPVNDTKVILTTKLSGMSNDYSYIADSKLSSVVKLVGPSKELSVQQGSGSNKILYSNVVNDDLGLYLKNLQSGEVSKISPTTIAGKCVLGIKNRENIYCAVPTFAYTSEDPYLWYQGKTHTNDNIWAINVNTGYSASIADPKKQFGISIDAEKLFLSPDEDYLFFTNRNDLTLWALKLVD